MVLVIFYSWYCLDAFIIINSKFMSDQEEDQIEDEENEEDEQNEEQQEEQQGDEDDQQGEEQDEDEDEDQDQQQEDQQGEQEAEQQQEGSSKQEQKPVPTFKPVSEEFTYKNLLADIASIGNSVDHFINTLPSRGGSIYRSYQPKIEYQSIKPRIVEPFEDKKYTIMKDEDIQVSMQPQIVIQQTLTPKQQPKKQPYRISNQSTKFLAQLYEENKKLKRWQNSQTGGGSTNNWTKSKQRFSRPEHERGLINLEDRNKEIDEAIELLRKQQNEY